MRIVVEVNMMMAVKEPWCADRLAVFAGGNVDHGDSEMNAVNGVATTAEMGSLAGTNGRQLPQAKN
jgi:hypothetical protein